MHADCSRCGDAPLRVVGETVFSSGLVGHAVRSFALVL